MKLSDRYRGEEPVCPAHLRRFDRRGAEQAAEISLLSEHFLEIFVNDAPTVTLTCTPGRLAELTLGRLLSEGIIGGAADVDRLDVSPSGHRAGVVLAPGVTAGQPGRPLRPLAPGRWTREQVFLCADRFAGDTPLHRKTRSAHSCFLLSGEKILFEAEDMGRHNAVDKALGWAMLHAVPLDEAALFISGRVPADMAEKVIRAGVGVLISKETVTKEALELAEAFGLTLIGRACADSFLLCCGQPPRE